jgi:hypothetical protein
MDTTANWPDLLKETRAGDHLVQVYEDLEFLVESVTEYLGAGLRRGEAAVVIARPEHRAAFVKRLGAEKAVAQGQLVLHDAEETLAKFMTNGMPAWGPFHSLIGGAIAELRLKYPAVRAYGEMVDVLWQRAEREAAIRLEEYWNEIGRLQTFSLFCAYRIDALDARAYGGLESVCKAHTHLIPTRDYERFDEAVRDASSSVLDAPLAQILLSLAAQHRTSTQMPAGQATLFWLTQNMPRTAEKVISELRARSSPAG